MSRFTKKQDLAKNWGEKNRTNNKTKFKGIQKIELSDMDFKTTMIKCSVS